jgi:hypothetical protein
MLGGFVVGDVHSEDPPSEERLQRQSPVVG